MYCQLNYKISRRYMFCSHISYITKYDLFAAYFVWFSVAWSQMDDSFITYRDVIKFITKQVIIETFCKESPLIVKVMNEYSGISFKHWPDLVILLERMLHKGWLRWELLKGKGTELLFSFKENLILHSHSPRSRWIEIVISGT